MKKSCPNLNCTSHESSKKLSSKSIIVKAGSYYRKTDSHNVQRYQCKTCKTRFSHATGTLEYRQKTRRINSVVEALFSSSVSTRRISIILNVNRATISKKLIYLGIRAERKQVERLKLLEQFKVKVVQIDDLITIEHTKLKPLTITIAIDKETRVLLGAEVRQIPSFGVIAKKSRDKYGHRESYHRDEIETLLLKIQKSISPTALFESDEHNLYPPSIRKYFTCATHKTYKSKRAAVIGQGELKDIRYDPIYMINHTLAMLRDNIKRLNRRTWCTTKDPEMLQLHLQVFIHYYNSNLI